MRILLAEDEEQLARVLKLAMEKAGYTVDQVADGQSAVDLAKENAYDVMILDIMMPVKTGLEALKEIRASGDRTYVMMLTAMAEVDDKVTGLDAGADDYMTKPFSLKELLARLRSLERRNDELDKDVLQFGDLTVDTNEQTLVSNNSISLTSKEARLLQYMILNANKDLSVDDLLTTLGMMTTNQLNPMTFGSQFHISGGNLNQSDPMWLSMVKRMVLSKLLNN